MVNSLKLILFIFLVCIPFSGSTQKQDSINTKLKFHVSAGMDLYKAYSQKKNSLVMKLGYPIFRGTSFQVGAGATLARKNKTHHLDLKIFHTPSLTSDDGLGNNFLLNKDKSNLTHVILEHQLQFKLFSYRSVDLDFAPLAGIDVQLCNLTYTNGAKEQTEDINLFLGIRTVPRYNISKDLSIQGGFDSFFYLPYTNMGILKKWNTGSELVEKSEYHAFYYRTRLHVAVNYHLKKTNILRIGYRNENTVGFANRQPLFYIDELVHHRMDQHHSIIVEYQF